MTTARSSRVPGLLIVHSSRHASAQSQRPQTTNAAGNQMAPAWGACQTSFAGLRLAAIPQHGGQQGLALIGSLLRRVLRELGGFLAASLLAQPRRVVLPHLLPVVPRGIQRVRARIEEQR